jgi:hypothetical protein
VQRGKGIQPLFLKIDKIIGIPDNIVLWDDSPTKHTVRVKNTQIVIFFK